MNEPSLLDYLKTRLPRRWLLRAALLVFAVYLAYKGALGLFAPPIAWEDVIVRWVLAAVLLAGAVMLGGAPAAGAASVASPALTLPAFRFDVSGMNAWRAARLACALVIAFLAQTVLFTTPQNYWMGLALWAFAFALWYPVWRAKPEASADAPALTQPAIHWRLALLGGAFSLIAFFMAGGEHLYTTWVVVPWVLGVSAWIWALSGWRLRPLAWWDAAQARLRGFTFSDFQIKLSWATLAALAIFILGATIRFYHLNDVPREMTSDHIEKLLDVNDALSGQYTLFFYRNTGREPLQFYYTAALIRLLNLPLSHLALKIGTALAGSVTLIFVYLLAKELLGTEVGLWAMLLSAIARWPIALSRAGLRYPFAPLLVAPTFYFLVRGLKSGRRSDFVWAGLCAGIGLHGYSSFRVVPIAILVIGVLWFLRPGLLWTRARLAGYFAALFVTTAITFAPLGRFMLDRPDLFWYRVLTRLGPAEQPLPADVLSVLGQNLYRVFFMFNYTRDVVWTVNIANWPALSPWLAALFGLGLVSLIVSALRQDRRALVAIVVWVLLLLPSGLSLAFPQENPSVARAGAAFPFVFLILAWPLVQIRRAVMTHWPGWGGRIAAVAGLAFVALSIGRNDFHDYFVTFRNQYATSATNPSEVGKVVRAFVAAGVAPDAVWLKGYPYWLDTRSVGLESFDTVTWNNSVMEPDQLEAAGTDARPKLFIVHIWDQPGIAKLRALYPNGVLEYHPSATEGKDFLTYFVPGAQDFDESTLPPPP